MHQTCVRDVEKIETNKYDADWSVLLHLRWLHLHLLQGEARLGLIRDLFSMSRWTAGLSRAPLLASRRLSAEKKASPFATTADAIDEYRTIEDLFPGLYLTLEVNSCGSLVEVVLLSILTEYPRRKLEAEDNHNEILRTEAGSSGLQQFYCHEEMMP